MRACVRVCVCVCVHARACMHLRACSAGASCTSVHSPGWRATLPSLSCGTPQCFSQLAPQPRSAHTSACDDSADGSTAAKVQACCALSGACCALSAARCLLLCVVCRALSVARCLLRVVCCTMSVARCLLRVVCSAFSVARSGPSVRLRRARECGSATSERQVGSFSRSADSRVRTHAPAFCAKRHACEHVRVCVRANEGTLRYCVPQSIRRNDEVRVLFAECVPESTLAVIAGCCGARR